MPIIHKKALPNLAIKNRKLKKSYLFLAT